MPEYHPWILEKLKSKELDQSIQDAMRETGLNPDSKLDNAKFAGSANRKAIEAGRPDRQITYVDDETNEAAPKPSRFERFVGFKDMDTSKDRVGSQHSRGYIPPGKVAG